MGETESSIFRETIPKSPGLHIQLHAEDALQMQTINTKKLLRASSERKGSIFCGQYYRISNYNEKKLNPHKFDSFEK